MRGIASCEGRTETVAFDGADNHNGWLTFVGGGLSVSGMEFEEIVAAHISTEVYERSIVKMRNQSSEAFAVE